MNAEKEVDAMRNVDEQQHIGLTEPGTYPFTLIIGRKITMYQDDHKIRDNKQWNLGSISRQGQEALAQMEMNPDDATVLRLQDGAKVRVTNEIGNVVLSIRRSSRLARGNLFVQITEPSTILVNLLTTEQKEASNSVNPLAQRAFMYTAVRIDTLDETEAVDATRAADASDQGPAKN